MRGSDYQQSTMFSYVSPEQRIPAGHPLRKIREITDRALQQLSGRLAKLYASSGRPSIAPEKLLRALLLQVFYSIRSERMLMEQLDYNLLFRWFVGLNLDEAVWDATVFSKNRDRLLEGEIAQGLFRAVLEQARQQQLLSEEHFSVDATLVEAWASIRSFQPKAEVPERGSGRGGKLQLNDTHGSKTDPDARMYKKSRGGESKLCHMVHALSENRHGLVVATVVTAPSPKQERAAAVKMLRGTRRGWRATVGADTAYDEAQCIRALRQLQVTPHVAPFENRSSNLDGRTTHQVGYGISQKRRKRIEQVFGWLKTTALLRKVRYRGREVVQWFVTLALAGYNMIRMRNLAVQTT